MPESAIKVENLSKRYRIGLKEEMHDSFINAMTCWLRAPLSNFKRLRSLSTFDGNGDGKDVIWALKDLSFEVKRGDVVGIIGSNGAGKTTLLKALSQIIEPTTGKIEINGRVASLLSVGAGFNQELTGRENIYMNGTILGMTKKEIDKKFNDIVAFSGVEKFIDTPVKRYSSGMLVRLGFSVAAYLEPEILLIDEILAVGDAEFQKKCLGKMEDISKGYGRTILFVSHNMSAIRSLCHRTILLQDGGIRADGETASVVDEYLSDQASRKPALAGEELEKQVIKYCPAGQEFFRLLKIALLDKHGECRNQFLSNEEITVSITLEVYERVPKLLIAMQLAGRDNSVLLRSDFADDPVSSQYDFLEPGVYQLSCQIPANSLGPQRFYVTIYLVYHNVQHITGHQITGFDVEFLGYQGKIPSPSEQAYFRPQLLWKAEQLSR